MLSKRKGKNAKLQYLSFQRHFDHPHHDTADYQNKPLEQDAQLEILG